MPNPHPHLVRGDSHDAVPGGLRLEADYGQLLAHDGVDERGLACVQARMRNSSSRRGCSTHSGALLPCCTRTVHVVKLRMARSHVLESHTLQPKPPLWTPAMCPNHDPARIQPCVARLPVGVLTRRVLGAALPGPSQT